ncbi:UNKNOWN [Stylonychia lemnae]|uniref:Uncharacterized protein n=1 Tax=Stylonychia lemnae TaxID=5949 RepID=A0A078AZR0_STYLE|nr:UNKNOWN [Stylonychia lemnae]|eukprot:CDW87895.1 UNKNOWN [Stylonychia lemnae]
MADVKFPNISQSNNNSFVDGRGLKNGGGLGEYDDQQAMRNGGDVRSQSFHSGRGGTGPGLAGQSIMNAKKQRKDIERDAQLLANRIALLKQEEMKTWKKIEETKKRAKEVNDLKRRNEDKMNNKFEKMRMEQMMQEENQNKINQMRKQREMERQKIQEAIYLSKKEEAKQQKYLQAQNRQRKNYFYDQVSQENSNKNNLIKQQERIAQMKRDEYMRRKQMEAKAELDKRIAEEEAVIRQKEQEVMQMEMLEMELIKKLQNTQAIQKQAYSELESALQQNKIGGNTSYTTGGLIAYGKVGANGGIKNDNQQL